MIRLIKTFSLGSLQTNCYLLQTGDSKNLIAVDPAESSPVSEFCRSSNWSISHIIATHGHYDHLTGIPDLKKEFNALTVCGEMEKEMLSDPEINFSSFFGFPVSITPDILIKDSEEFLGLKVFHTPGHTEGGIILCAAGFALTGDTIFRESIGRTDFPGGDYASLIRSIREKIFTLPPMTFLYPGHGPQTTVIHETQHNPFLIGIGR